MDGYGYGFAYGGSILLRSQNCASKISELEGKTRMLKIWEHIFGGIGLAIAIGPVLLSLVFAGLYRSLNGNTAVGSFTVNWMIALALNVPIWIVNVKIGNPLREFCMKYKSLCEKETLTVNADGIAGMGAAGGQRLQAGGMSFQLRYDQIASVYLERNTDAVFQNSVGNDLLFIRDTSDNLYRFSSFVNSRELRFVIDEQIKKLSAAEVDSAASGAQADQPPPSAAKNTPHRADGKQAAHFSIRPDKVTCPYCGCRQRSDRIVCFQCGCEFVFDE